MVPCGIADRKATSLEKLLARAIAVSEIAAPLAKHLGAVLRLEMQAVPRVQFLEALQRAEQNAHTSAPHETPAAERAPELDLEHARSDA
jgi:lipoate-protein ligase B